MFLSLKALLTAFLVLMLIRESIACSVPEIRDKENDTMDYYVNEGMDIKLICWVQQRQSRAQLSVYWQKDNKTLQPAEHPRMKIKIFRSLKIKKARKEDAGFYTCVAENECGGKNALFMHLFVRESDAVKNSTPVAPKFTINKRWLTDDLILLAVPAGNLVKLDCSAEGYPRPTVKWYKDGALFLERKGGARVHFGPWKSVLVMKDLVPTDAGKYTCNVSNIQGWINLSYKVDVHESVRAKPVVLEIENVTTFVGGNATLLCQAFSDAMPHFEWLRWFTLHSNSTGNGTEIQKPHFEVIKQNKQNDFVTKRFISEISQSPKYRHFSEVTLTLVNVTKKDEGRYTCNVGNVHGYDMKQAYIIVQEETVHGDRNTSQNLRNNSKTAAIHPGDTPESKASGKERGKPENASAIRYPGVLIGVSVAVIFITITVSSWICWKLKRTRASSNSRPPDIDFLQARYKVQNEYVIVPNFK